MMRINDEIQDAKLLPPGRELNRHDRNAVPSWGYSDKRIFLLSAAECPKTLVDMEDSLRADEESEQGNSLWCQKL